MELEFRHLEEGKSYVSTSPNPGFLFKKIGECYGVSYIWTTKKEYYNNNGDLKTNFKLYREATKEEIAHLEECIEAGKFVEYKPININNYSIWN